VRDQRLAAIEQRRSDPSMLATVAIHSEIFASRVPYSRPLAGTQESVSSFDSSSLRGYAEARIRPLGGGMAVAGPIPAESVEASVARVFGGWTGAPEVTSEVEAAPRHPGPGVLILDRPGAVQSEIRLGHVGIERASPDYFPLRVFNGVLGGTFTSRLNLNLRERNGFTYGVRSSFRARRGRGPFTVATGVGTEHTVDAVREAFSEIRHLLDGGPSPDEIEAVKDYLVGVFPLTVETTGQLAGRLGELFPYGLPDDYHARWRDQISGVSAAGAHEAGRRNLRPGDLRVVVVGDSGAMRSGLEALGLGSVETIPAAEWDPQP